MECPDSPLELGFWCAAAENTRPFLLDTFQFSLPSCFLDF